MADRINNKIHKVWLAEGIVHSEGMSGSQQTKADAEHAVADVWEVAGHQKRPLLVDLRWITSMDRGARNHYAGSATVEIVSATGLLIGSPLTRVLANFFMGINKPLVPTRMFTSESEALVWLRGFVQNP